MVEIMLGMGFFFFEGVTVGFFFEDLLKVVFLKLNLYSLVKFVVFFKLRFKVMKFYRKLCVFLFIYFFVEIRDGMI